MYEYSKSSTCFSWQVLNRSGPWLVLATTNHVDFHTYLNSIVELATLLSILVVRMPACGRVAFIHRTSLRSLQPVAKMSTLLVKISDPKKFRPYGKLSDDVVLQLLRYHSSRRPHTTTSAIRDSCCAVRAEYPRHACQCLQRLFPLPVW